MANDPGTHATRRHAGRPAAALTAAALLLASACGGSGGSASGVTSVTIGAPPVVGLGDLYTAESRHLFEAHRLRVKVRSVNGGAQVVPALQSGAVDIGQSNIVSVLQARQRHLNISCFAAAFRSPSGPQLALVVSRTRAAAIRTPAALAGTTIAVNTLHNANQLIAEKYLQSQGVNPASVHFIGLDYPSMPGALSAGRVAAAIVDEPFTTTVVSQGSKIMSPQPDSEITPHPVYACWMASSSWLSHHRDVASRFTAALNEADRYMAAHPGYLSSILPKYTKVSAQLAGRVTLPDFTTAITPADVRPWSQAAAQFKITDSVVPPSSIITSPK
jgi:NitT/TauT family transport system substrate-binding protein